MPTIQPLIDEDRSSPRLRRRLAQGLATARPVERLTNLGETEGRKISTLSRNSFTIELQFSWKERSPIQFGESAVHLWRLHVED